MSDFESLEDADLALEAEQLEWEKAGLNLAQLQLGALAPLILDLSTRVQALTNALILKGILTDDEINLQFKTVLYNNMVALRQGAPEQQREDIRRRILATAAMGINGSKMPWER